MASARESAVHVKRWTRVGSRSVAPPLPESLRRPDHSEQGHSAGCPRGVRRMVGASLMIGMRVSRKAILLGDRDHEVATAAE
jgi:hypothetical protein